MEEHATKHVREGSTAYSVPPKLLSKEEQRLVSELVEDGLAIQERFRPERRYRQTGKGHFDANTVDEIQTARKKEERDP